MRTKLCQVSFPGSCCYFVGNQKVPKVLSTHWTRGNKFVSEILCYTVLCLAKHLRLDTNPLMLFFGKILILLVNFDAFFTCFEKCKCWGILYLKAEPQGTAESVNKQRLTLCSNRDGEGAHMTGDGIYLSQKVISRISLALLQFARRTKLSVLQNRCELPVFPTTSTQLKINVCHFRNAK